MGLDCLVGASSWPVLFAFLFSCLLCSRLCAPLGATEAPSLALCSLARLFLGGSSILFLGRGVCWLVSRGFFSRGESSWRKALDGFAMGRVVEVQKDAWREVQKEVWKFVPDAVTVVEIE